MRKPIIGVILNEQKTLNGNYIRGIYIDVNKVISESGCIAIGISTPQTNSFYNLDINSTPAITDAEFSDMKLLIDMCDGIICQGGDEYFDCDLKVIDYCYQQDIPLLGICLGMQTMSCLFNGEMVDIGRDNHKQNKDYVHEVYIDPESLLFKILNESSILVNSYHKSHVIKTDLDISAFSDDGIIEAVEDKNKRFFLGTQWHPEKMVDYDENAKKIIDYFFDVCKEKIRKVSKTFDKFRQ